MENFSDEKWLDWVDTLSQNDYLIIDNFISDELYQKLRIFLLDKLDENAFSLAGIGALATHRINNEIRGDFVYWLDKEHDLKLAELFAIIQSVMTKLNELCYLSLTGHEFHLAHYPPGSYYKRHLDQFKGTINNRLITLIIYLNEDWKVGDGGELRIFREKKSDLIVNPIGRRAVIFKSDVLEHEVLVTNKIRFSLTGWLLNRPASFV